VSTPSVNETTTESLFHASSYRAPTEARVDRTSTVSPTEADDVAAGGVEVVCPTVDVTADSEGLVVGERRLSSPLARLNSSYSSTQFRSLAPPPSLMSPTPDERDGLSSFFSPRAVLTAGLRKRYEDALLAAAAEPYELDETGAVVRE
jgi:hypothetical protein